ncbi:hypothetical protein [Nocardiopsis alborubida]|uniref:Uncharacterized protein n=1 Tax=Nocardiopsis alborubida TaxID=146802 RepID=A0A7X6MIA6_9ACTN|nr:hypothetical protein [Nocardiopsis alborubida]NKZ02079.1 hypothetical protein [Nocardiopsis alborubida]
MDAIEQLQHLQEELTARGLPSQISDKPHWFSLNPVPTLTCCPYLGYAQVTVTEHGLYRWLDGKGDYRTHPRVFAGLVVDDLIRTRAGTSTPPELPEWNKTAKQIAPPLPRRSEWRRAREQEE